MYAVPGSWSSLTQTRSLSCVVVNFFVKKCIWFTSSIAPRHWIVAFRKHVFPVFRSPWPDFVGEGLLLTFRSGSRGRFILFSAFLKVESCLVPVSCRRAGAWRGVVRLTTGVLILEPGVGSRKACGVGLCLVSCGGLFSVFSPLSFLSSYFDRLPTLSILSISLLSGTVFLRRVFSHVGQGGWSIPPLFVTLSTTATVQAYHFLYCVAYCCQPVPRISDVGLLNKVNFPVPHRI